MLLLKLVWQSTSIYHKIFVYMLDIATTVTFWEALTILFVKTSEQRMYHKDMQERFKDVFFEEFKE